MNADQGIFVPLLLGIVEGLTEFIPVSSTGHLLLIGHFLGFDSPGRTFEVLIQLGAILAIITVYFQKLLVIARDALVGRKRYAWIFILAIALASFPAALAGVLAHDFIKTVLYESPIVICVALIVGGVILLFVDQIKYTPKYKDIMDIPPLTALLIGLFQMIALIPGVSRSGATSVGGMLLGTDKRTAAEFSFFIALPIMIGAFGYDLYKSREYITSELGIGIAIGFAAAFVSAALVVRYVLGFISRHGFAPFAYWRIFVGAIGLWALLLIK